MSPSSYALQAIKLPMKLRVAISALRQGITQAVQHQNARAEHKQQKRAKAKGRAPATAPLLMRLCPHAPVAERRRSQVTRRPPTRARSGAQKPRVGRVERRGGQRCASRCAWRCGVVCRAEQILVRRGEQTAGTMWRGQQQCELGVRVTAARSASHPCQTRTGQ